LSWKFSVFARNVENGLPDRQKWTILRILNGLVLRKGLRFLKFPLRLLERLEISRQRTDPALLQITKELFHKKEGDFSSLGVTNGLDESASNTLISKAHIRVLERIFGKKEANQMEVVKNLRAYLRISQASGRPGDVSLKS
jgi:non-homologous end joining protein Ku